MQTAITPARQLRQLLDRPGIIPSLGAHDVFSAMLMERAGIELIFLGGFGTAASQLGLPDLHFLTLSEMADAIRRTTARVSIPVIADGDTGHGDLVHVQRTVREFERAGAAGILIEDQAAPKRCGHFEGKELVSTEEMLLRLRAALEARQDPDFVVIGRTDARAVHGLDDALERAQRFVEAGVDVVFVEAPESRTELERVAHEVPAPQLLNLLTGGKTPILSLAEAEALGFKIGVAPIESLLVTARAVEGLCAALLQTGRVDHLAPERMSSFGEVKKALGLDALLDLRRRLSTEISDPQNDS